jgi:hypothetical protein
MSNQELVNTHLKKSYVDISTLLEGLRGFYLQLTKYEQPFLVQSDDVAPAQRIHFLCREVVKELDFRGTPAYFQIVIDMFKAALEHGEMMYAPRMVDMFLESLEDLPDDVTLSYLFEGEDSAYDTFILPFIQRHRREDLPRVLTKLGEIKSKIESKALLLKLSDSERSKVTEILNSRIGKVEARAQEVSERSVEKIFAKSPDVLTNIRKNVPELLTSPCVGVYKFMDFDDDMDYMNSAIAIITEDNIALIPKKLNDSLFKKAGKNHSWSLDSIQSLRVGDEHSRVHFGFDSNDWQKIHLSWTLKGGLVITTTICSGMSRDEGQSFFNQRVRPLLGELANHFPVTLDGGHIESTSGYRTAISFGVWI